MEYFLNSDSNFRFRPPYCNNANKLNHFFNTCTAEPILDTRTAKGASKQAAPAMIFDIFQVLLDKFTRFSAFDRGMMAAPQDIKSLSGCYALRSKWRPKLENWKNTTKIGRFRINEHNYFSGHVISEIPTATPIFATMPNSTVPLSTLTDIRRQPENKMASFIKPEIHCISGLV